METNSMPILLLNALVGSADFKDYCIGKAFGGSAVVIVEYIT
jgi:hypothetical protein